MQSNHESRIPDRQPACCLIGVRTFCQIDVAYVAEGHKREGGECCFRDPNQHNRFEADDAENESLRLEHNSGRLYFFSPGTGISFAALLYNLTPDRYHRQALAPKPPTKARTLPTTPVPQPHIQHPMCAVAAEGDSSSAYLHHHRRHGRRHCPFRLETQYNRFTSWCPN